MGSWIPAYRFPVLGVSPDAISPFVSLGRLFGRASAAASHPNAFLDYSKVTFWVVIYQLCRYVVSLFETELTVSLRNGICALVLVVGIPAQGWVIYDYFIKSGATTYFRLATRRVPGWVWLHAGEPTNKFEPVWSIILWIFVVSSAPALVYFWAISMGELTRATGNG